MSMQIIGKIIKVMPMESGVSKQGNPWSKQQYLLETLERYPKQVCFEVMSDNIARFNLQEEQVVTVDVDLSSREYNGKYYTTVSAWKVSSPQHTAQASTAAPQM